MDTISVNNFATVIADNFTTGAVSTTIIETYTEGTFEFTFTLRN